MLDVLVQENSQGLWTELCDRQVVCSESQVVVECISEKEKELLNAFAESYLNKLSLKEMREFIQTVISYRHNIARRYRMIHGRAAPLPN